jgi:O6-methylguanine-DNA--protein-cysteine methyltransferase
VEAYILSILSKEEIFKNNSQNFSYYLAEDYASYNYSYYYKGYRNRNISISNKLTEDKNLRAFVFDLSNYYPSMYKKIYQFLRRIPKGKVISYKTLADFFCTSPRAIGKIMN